MPLEDRLVDPEIGKNLSKEQLAELIDKTRDKSQKSATVGGITANWN
ncbi:MAG: hypothetical protein KDJ35_07910 [Alphaproteobacteria bacterium]|nr:hypothetical protein [Alphaproteobacteria bacterium]